MNENPTPQMTTGDLQLWEYRPVQKADGWSVEDGWGYSSCYLTLTTKKEAEAWIAGYEQGARENQ